MEKATFITSQKTSEEEIDAMAQQIAKKWKKSAAKLGVPVERMLLTFLTSGQMTADPRNN